MVAKNKIGSNVFLFAIVTMSLLRADSTCEQISKYVLQAYPIGEQKTIGDVAAEPKQSEATDGDLSEEESTGYDQEKFFNFFTQEIVSPQEYAKKKRAYQILASAEKQLAISWPTGCVIDEQVWQDLNILCGNREHPTHFLGEILTTQRVNTEIGKAYFNGLIARPISDIDLLKNRQLLVRELVSNKQLFEKLDTLLHDFSLHEAQLTGLWGNEQLMQFLKQEAYFRMTRIKGWPRLSQFLNYFRKKGNKSEYALELKALLDKVDRTSSVVMRVAFPLMLTSYGIATISGLIQVPERLVLEVDNWMKSRLYQPSCAIIFALIYTGLEKSNQKARGMTAIGAGYSGVSNIPNAIKWLQYDFKYDDFLRKRLIHVAECVKIMNHALKIVPKSMQIQLTCFSHIKRLFTELPKINEDLKKVIKSLNTETFDKKYLQDETTLLYRRGRVLCVYRLLDQIKTFLDPAIAAIGELDAFMTAAKLIQQEGSSRVGYCFAEYVIEQEYPILELKDYWNPFLDPNTVVTNSMQTGVRFGVPHMVITGPNSAGKSTVMKSIALSVVLAQSIGIAPAKYMLLAPFSHVALYMNIGDSIIDRESRFQREAKQAFAHGDLIREFSEQGRFSLAIFDEIFSGTSPQEGAEWGYKMARGFGRYLNSMCIIATHFVELTNLETVTNGHFVNYKVSIQEDESGNFVRNDDGTLKRTYTLERGISHQHVAHEVLKEQGIRSQFFGDNIA